MTHFDLIPSFWLAIPFLFLLIFANWLGHQFKMLYIKKFPDVEDVGMGPTEGSLLGLTALMLSFTFGMSSSKYENRRQLIVQEANNIGTTILRADLYPDSVRKNLRADLKNYLEERIKYYSVGYNEEQIKMSLEKTDSISKTIWNRITVFAHDPDYRVASTLMIPSMNSMIDIVTTREASRKAVVPGVVLSVLCILIVISAFLAGYGSKNRERNRVLVLAFAIVSTLALYLVVDLSKPRHGLINLEEAQKLIVDLRSNFTDNK
jgi:hypothetical protein